MNQSTLEHALSGLPLGPLRYFERIGSTNDEAARWAESGAPHLSLVLAGEQTAGRGRLNRSWFTPPAAALAFSLVLRPPFSGQAARASNAISQLTVLGALAVSEALEGLYGLQPRIKWPNDVLLEGRKTAGILAEAFWLGEELNFVILGIGVNTGPAAVPPDSDVIFPATCVETSLGRPVERIELLSVALERLLSWLPRLGSSELHRAWEDRLAYRDDWVWIYTAKPGETVDQQEADGQEARVLGLERDGSLRLVDRSGRAFTLQTGEVRLRPIDRSSE